MIIFCYSSDDGAPFYNCLLCHVPYKPNSAPFPVNLSVCAICRYAQISRDYTFHFETTSCMKTMQLFGMVFLKFILLTTFCFWKFKKFNFFYILRWTMTNLNFDFIFLQEAKGAWCFVYNHRSSTGNTNPRQRRIYTSQVSHQCALTQLIITFNYQECCLTLIFCLHRVCRPKPKSKGGESNAKEISDVWSCCFPYFNTCM